MKELFTRKRLVTFTIKGTTHVGYLIKDNMYSDGFKIKYKDGNVSSSISPILVKGLKSL